MFTFAVLRYRSVPFLLLLTGLGLGAGACSSSGDSGVDTDASTSSVGFASEALVQEGFSSLKSDLDGSETYSLSQDEINLLASEEIVTESEELQALGQFVKK